MLKDPELIRIGEADGTLSRWSYLHELDDGTERQVMVRSLVVFRDPRVHTFHMVDSPTSWPVSESTWSEFMASIRYDT